MTPPAKRRRRRAPSAPPAPVHDLDGMLRRLHLPTVRRLHSELATRAEAEGMSYRTYLETLIAEEIAHRAETRLTRAVRKARFPFLRTIDDFTFTFQTALKLQMLGSSLGPELVSEGKNAIFSGAPGVGKTHLAVALGLKACELGQRTMFTTAAGLITALGKALYENRLEERLKLLTQRKLLIIDEIGYIPIDRQGANLFFQLISRRYERGSILVTSNQSLGAWGEVFGDTVIASAILDRLLHHATTVNIKGESYRLKEKRRAGLLRPDATASPAED